MRFAPSGSYALLCLALPLAAPSECLADPPHARNAASRSVPPSAPGQAPAGASAPRGKVQIAPALPERASEAPIKIDPVVDAEMVNLQQQRTEAVRDKTIELATLVAAQWTMLFTGLAAFVAALQAFFFRRQLGIMEQTLGDTAAAANAALSSAETARITAESYRTA